MSFRIAEILFWHRLEKENWRMKMNEPIAIKKLSKEEMMDISTTPPKQETDRIVFQISGNDYKNLQRFRKQHENCDKGMAAEQFSYSFVPTGLGLLTTVTCSCGQRLELGNFMDHESGEYDEERCRVLTEEDRRNRRFEEAAYKILIMRSPRIFRMAFQMDQTFERVYLFAVGKASEADDRISKCIRWTHNRGSNGENIDQYNGLEEQEKLDAFFRYFTEHVQEELQKYDCKNELLLRTLKESEI